MDELQSYHRADCALILSRDPHRYLLQIVLPHFLLPLLGLVSSSAQHGIVILGGSSNIMALSAQTQMILNNTASGDLTPLAGESSSPFSFGLFDRLALLALLILANRMMQFSTSASLPQKNYTPLLERMLMTGFVTLVVAGLWSCVVSAVLYYSAEMLIVTQHNAASDGVISAQASIGMLHAGMVTSLNAGGGSGSSFNTIHYHYLQRYTHMVDMFEFWTQVDAIMMLVLAGMYLQV